MKVTNDMLQALYNKIFTIHLELMKTDTQNDPQWGVKRYCKYSYCPVLGLYSEKDEQLFKILNSDFTDEDLSTLLIPIIERGLNKLLNTETDIMTEIKLKSYQNQLSLLRDRKIEEWMELVFIPCYNIGVIEIDESHFRGLCYVIYGYKNFQDSITSVYNGNIDVLKDLYQGVLGKDSELHTYKLIEITPDCKMLVMDPPRIYDSRIDKTFYLSNVSKELLNTFIELGISKFYDKISIRVSNSLLNIFDGRYELQILTEALERGKVFSIQNLGAIPVTKLYSTNYEDCLWIKCSDSEITFEELCEHESTFNGSTITQVIHLSYLNKGNETFITHIDHEFVFYSKSDYEKRKTNSDIKGTEYPRLKSFKIDKANIPLAFPINHNVALYDEASDSVLQKVETVPFIIYILKSYLKHTNLIDEYFEKL